MWFVLWLISDHFKFKKKKNYNNTILGIGHIMSMYKIFAKSVEL